MKRIHAFVFGIVFALLGLTAVLHPVLPFAQALPLGPTAPCPECVPPTAVTLNGPIVGDKETPQTFVAAVQPPTTTVPLTYTWQVNEETFTHTGGLSNTLVYTWAVSGWSQVTVQVQNGAESVSDSRDIQILPLTNCDTYPIAPSIFAESLTDEAGSNPFPASIEFDYPNPAPTYADFPHNVPLTPLSEAENGTIYKINNGSGQADFAWLVWNVGIAGSSSTLANSLTPPGNINDYSNHGGGGGGQPATPFYNWIVRGYVNPYDASDLLLNQGDWILGDTGSVNSEEVRVALRYLIDTQTVIRLPIRDELNGTGNNARLHTAEFGFFRLHGYHLALGAGSWLLLEFVGPSGECPAPIVALNGPTAGETAVNHTFSASVEPMTATLPITYTWSATGQGSITITGGLTSTAVYSWTTPGTYQVTVFTQNALGRTADRRTITVFELSHTIYLPLGRRDFTPTFALKQP